MFFRKLTKRQILIFSLIFTVIMVCGVSSVAYYNYQMELKEEENVVDAESMGMEELEKPKELEDAAEPEEPEEPESEVVEVVQQTKNISFSGTSIDKDLKIKIVDENSALVLGKVFEIIVYPEGKEDKAKSYADENMNGIIHIKNMDGGNYMVKLQELEGFAIKDNPILVNVKEKIEYVKVDVKNEIKKEEEIDVEAEDVKEEREKAEVVEKPKDTTSNVITEEKPVENGLSLLESTVTVTKVEKEKVSTANFTTAAVSETMIEEIIGETIIRIPDSIILYEQGRDESKSCKIELEIVSNEMSTSVMPLTEVPETETPETEEPETETPETQMAEIEIQKIEWSVDYPDIASLSMDSGTEVTVSAGKKGQAIVSACVTYLDESKEEQTKTLQSTVLVGDFTDDATQLLDLDGNGLYLDSEAKQIATLKDYSEADVFYGLPKYTGWQIIDEKTYYFDENNQPVKGEQKIGNFHYTFDENGVLVDTAEKMGIDVSKWQEDIDWRAVADAGIDFAIIRVGYRGIKTGVMVEDPYFKANIAGATKAGIKVGVYFYTQALTEAEAIEEASMAMELVKGYHLDYPIFIDTEGSGGKADSLSKDARTQIVKAFCETVINGGYKPGVYANKHWLETKLHTDQLSSYMIWVAQYSSECTYSGKYEMWQYTDSGTVDGVKWKVDLNICYKGL